MQNLLPVDLYCSHCPHWFLTNCSQGNSGATSAEWHQWQYWRRWGWKDYLKCDYMLIFVHQCNHLDHTGTPDGTVPENKIKNLNSSLISEDYFVPRFYVSLVQLFFTDLCFIKSIRTVSRFWANKFHIIWFCMEQLLILLLPPPENEDVKNVK